MIFVPKTRHGNVNTSRSVRHARRGPSRLRVLMIAILIGAGLTGTASAQANPMTPVPLPAPVPVKDNVAAIPETRLWYWDTGGGGAPIVLLHPATGSALIWGYQQPVFANAGYRVIGYSRRGYINSAPFEPERPGSGSEDLRQLADHLG